MGLVPRRPLQGNEARLPTNAVVVGIPGLADPGGGLLPRPTVLVVAETPLRQAEAETAEPRDDAVARPPQVRRLANAMGLRRRLHVDDEATTTLPAFPKVDTARLGHRPEVVVEGHTTGGLPVVGGGVD